MTSEQCKAAIAVLDRFIEHPEKWNHPVNIQGVSGMISPELIKAAIEERERLTAILGH